MYGIEKHIVEVSRNKVLGSRDQYCRMFKDIVEESKYQIGQGIKVIRSRDKYGRSIKRSRVWVKKSILLNYPG